MALESGRLAAGLPKSPLPRSLPVPLTVRRLLALVLSALIFLTADVSVAIAAPGDLDPTFGSGGLVAISGYGTPTRAGGMTLQGDGKIVTVGETVSEDWAISRFNSDGTPDTSFSGDGVQSLDMGGSDSAADVAVQPDGKLVVVGWATVAGRDVFGVARFEANGDLDSSFSDDGLQTTDFAGSGASATAVALQSDGRIVVVGTANGDYALARYNIDGSLDWTFGNVGTKTTNLGFEEQGATAVAVQPDGKLVVTGLAANITNEEPDDFLVLRYTADGALDPGFSGDGVQITTWDDDSDALDVALQPDGKIMVIGDAYSNVSGGFDFGVARYLPDGTPDSSFSDDGQTLVDFGDDNDFPTALALQPDGKIVVVGGTLATGIGHAFALARLNLDGSLDADFGDDGKVTTVFDAGDAHAYGVAIQADTQIVAAGDLIPTVSGPDQLAMARYEGGGSLPAPQPPSNSQPPVISGTPTVGSTLSASTGTWSGDEPISFSYQWLQDGGPIAGATASSYIVSSADQGHQLAVEVTATNASGSASAISAAASVPAAPVLGPGDGPPIDPPPAVVSVASVGRALVRGSLVLVPVSCSAGGGCPNITASLSVTERLRAGRVVAVAAKKRLGTKRVVVGKASVSLAGGQSKQLALRLNRVGRRLLRRFGRIKATLRVVEDGRAMRRVGVRIR
jgi:uncharacterized delta-60 repeat protein